MGSSPLMLNLLGDNKVIRKSQEKLAPEAPCLVTYGMRFQKTVKKSALGLN
jgi:hypothetical protein